MVINHRKNPNVGSSVAGIKNIDPRTDVITPNKSVG
jgi:hypothetical protein